MSDMVDEDGSENPDPILKPRLVRLLQERPKLVESEMRDRFLDTLDEEICRRRDPEMVSGQMARSLLRASEPAFRSTTRAGLETANQTVLSRF